jgi:pyruvate/2-oxoglutarate dehydrogenase complex dihydrolipoamide acyltransferase (E2) component
VDTEIPSPVSGVLLEIVVGDDDTAESAPGWPWSAARRHRRPYPWPLPPLLLWMGPRRPSHSVDRAAVRATVRAQALAGSRRLHGCRQQLRQERRNAAPPAGPNVAEPETAHAPPAAVAQTPRKARPKASSLRGQTVRMSRTRKITGITLETHRSMARPRLCHRCRPSATWPACGAPSEAPSTQNGPGHGRWP